MEHTRRTSGEQVQIQALNEYQKQATDSAIYPGKGTVSGLVYCALKLNGEAGEVAENVGKALRDDNSEITHSRRLALVLELGDVLWYIANLADELGFTLSVVAQGNLDKLADRKARGVLRGSGDNR